jgi:dipeptidase
MERKVRIKGIIAIFLLLLFFAGLAEAENNCFTIIAGKDATDDGSVMIAHNEDDNGKNFFVNVHKVRGNTVKKSPGFLWLEIPGVEFGDSYMNENGVVITSNACQSRENKPELTDGGIGFKLRRLVAEQATSARHAVEIAGKLIRRYGYYSSGRSYAIADAEEAWVLQIVKGKHWIAKRVPDDHVAVIANRYTIDTVHLKRKKFYKGSSDLVTYAVRRKWHDPAKDGEFNFARTYATPDNYNHEHNVMRQWRGTALLAKAKIKIDEPLPFSFEPRKKIKVTDLFRVLRDHYEDTKYDLTDDYKKGSPNKTAKRTICTDSTRYSFVAQMRREMPREIAHLAWIAFRRPDTNAYSPWYFSINTPPEGYALGNSMDALKNHLNPPVSLFQINPKYAYWTYANLSRLVDQDYRTRIKIARKEWRNFENYALKVRKKREREFTYFIKKNKHIALKLITNYVRNLEYRKWFLAFELTEKLNK